ncbi:response regulator [bacterium]|nr:response regulator [bacterium]
MKEKIKILYAEDNEFDADLAKVFFQKKAPEFELEIVDSGEKCLEILEKKEFGALLLDYRLPDLNGIEVINRLVRKKNSIPVVIVTGMGDEEIVIQALRVGATDYVAKDEKYLLTLPDILQNVVEQNKKMKKYGNLSFTHECKVLYIENNQMDVDLTLRHCQKEAPHIKITAVYSAKEAFNLLKHQNDFNLALVDLRMPDLNGLEILRTAKHQKINLPFIIITGKGDEETAVAALKLGAYDYIIKKDDYLTKLPYSIDNAVLHFQLNKNYAQLQDELFELNKSLEIKVQERTQQLQNKITDYLESQKALDENKTLLQSILKNSETIILVKNLDGKYLLINKAYEDVIGISKEKIIGKTDYDFYPKEIADSFHKNDLKVITERKPITVEETLQTKKGLRTYFTLKIPLFDTAENFYGICGITTDVTEKKELQNKLEQSEHEQRILAERQTGVLNALPAHIALLDKDGIIISVNEPWKTFAKNNKLSCESSCVGAKYLEICEKAEGLFSEEAKSVSDGIRKVLSNQAEQFVIEYPCHSPAEQRWFKLMVTPLIKGENKGAVVMHLNITELRKNQILLQNSEEKYRNLINNFSQGVFIFQDEKVVFANPAMLELVGYENSEILALKEGEIFNLIHKDDRERVKSVIQQNYAKTEDLSKNQYRVYRKNGEIRWIETLVRKIHFNEKLSLLVVATDITDAKNAQQQVEESEKKYKILFEESKDVIFFSNQAGKFIDINPAGVQLFGYASKEEILAIDIENDLYVNKEDRLILKKTFQERSQIKDYEVRLKNKNGEELIVLETATAVKNQNDEIVLIRGILRDVTEQRRFEKQFLHTQKLEAIGTLAGGIAHDFNNILTGIIGYAELSMFELSQTNLKAKNNVEQILIAGKRAKDLVKQILTFSRKTDLERKPLQIDSVLNEAMKLIRSTLPSTIEIIQKIPDCGMILANSTQIHQIIMNLCTNSYYAMQEKGGTLEVELTNFEANDETIRFYPALKKGDYIKISVSDTGSGIDKSIIDKIFDPFFSTKPQDKGTGMGLSVVHGIIRNHEGLINVYSEVNKGTVFNVYLPKIKEEKTEENLIVKQLPRGNERILFVDDEMMISEMYKEMLEILGYTVTTKNDGWEALKTFLKTPKEFDLLITDLTMPKMTGIELAQEILSIRPEIPIILITGFSEGITREKAKELKINDFVMKPVVFSEIASSIRKALDKK